MKKVIFVMLVIIGTSNASNVAITEIVANAVNRVDIENGNAKIVGSALRSQNENREKCKV